MNRKIKVFIAGDSTASEKLPEKWPETGWGMKIQEFFTEDVEFHNYAVNGRSSKSFIDEGHLNKILERIEVDDYLFIQFGHNDEKTDEERHTKPFSTYKEYMIRYINGARAAGAHPVLLTSVYRRFFREDGTLEDTHGDYLKAVRELALQENVPLIDIADKSRQLFEELGPEKTKELFLWLQRGQSSNYPEGVEDNTHFNESGARAVAKLVVEGILENNLTLLVGVVRGVGL